jgi:hypothetical protein
MGLAVLSLLRHGKCQWQGVAIALGVAVEGILIFSYLFFGYFFVTAKLVYRKTASMALSCNNCPIIISHQRLRF